MYLALKNLKLGRKIGEQQSGTQKGSTNDYFQGENIQMSLMQLQIKLQKTVKMNYLEVKKKQNKNGIT